MMGNAHLHQMSIGLIGVVAILCASGAVRILAQTASSAGQGQVKTTETSTAGTRLPTIQIRGAERKRATHKPRAAAGMSTPPTPVVDGTPTPFQRFATDRGVVGYLATRSTTATKTDTPLINVPQSVSVLTKEFIRDQNFQSLTDATRYAPGVIPHQGEGNRDQVVIRGQNSSADFYVDGVRDDIQYYRDFYNNHRVEVIKGPDAMIFGRGGAGGIINRVGKDADGVPIKELTLQGGSFSNKRASIDLGGVVNSALAARFNAVYEDTDTFRQFGHIERYGVNPTFQWLPNDSTSVKFSYEYFHDRRVADRGIPSQAGTVPKLYPYETAPSTFFGNPNLNYALLDAQFVTGVIEHDFDSGAKIRNVTKFANYEKFYQNAFPGGPVNAAGTSVNLTAYNNDNDRKNLFNQTDLTYKLDTGMIRQTLLAGAELGRQTGRSFRQSGFFNGSPTLAISPLNPVSYAPVTFTNIATDANSRYRLDLAAAYLQDQIEITKYLQLIGGIRFDRFDLGTTDQRSLITQTRIDNLWSPRAGVIIKPVENVSIYGAYSVSYLPSAGDQFSVLSPGTAISEPEKLVNKEVGIKWEVTPRLILQSALYNLVRTNQRLADPNNPGFFILSGETETNGLEASITGYLTEVWQVVGGYAYTDARITGATSATVTPGNRVGLVPYNVFTLWNKYQFTDLYAAGIGVIHQTDSYASSDDTVVLPGWTRVDGAVFGKIDRHYLPEQIKELHWQINVENVFGAKYYATANGNNNIAPGSPRAVRGTLVAEF
jgi:catecholate siderophore receptor